MIPSPERNNNMSKIVIDESLAKHILPFLDAETNAIQVETLDEVADVLFEHPDDPRKTLGMLNCVRNVRSLVVSLQQATLEE